MKNIAFLVSGNIRIYEKNLSFLENLKKEFYNYEIIFICSFWQNKKKCIPKTIRESGGSAVTRRPGEG